MRQNGRPWIWNQIADGKDGKQCVGRCGQLLEVSGSFRMWDLQPAIAGVSPCIRENTLIHTKWVSATPLAVNRILKSHARARDLLANAMMSFRRGRQGSENGVHCQNVLDRDVVLFIHPSSAFVFRKKSIDLCVDTGDHPLVNGDTHEDGCDAFGNRMQLMTMIAAIKRKTKRMCPSGGDSNHWRARGIIPSAPAPLP